MSDQPIIVQQQSNNSSKQKQLNKQQQAFFEVLDAVESYDKLSKQIRILHQEAMISLASLKFSNLNNISINAHKCLPAFLSLNQQGQLKEGYLLFTKEIHQDKYFEQFEQQNQIEQECIKKQQNSENEDLIKYKQSQILYRFNVMNEPKMMLSVSAQFQELLKKLLYSTQRKKQLQKILQTHQRIQRK